MRDSDGKGYSPTYLKTISAQMSAIFNHASRYYDLKNNPCKKVGNMGKKKGKEMLFWTRDEFFQFIDTMKSKPLSYYAFELLFWTGIREGELLALTKEDIDAEFEKQAKFSGITAEEFKKSVNEQFLNQIVNNLVINKLLDFLKSNNNM